MPVRSSRLLLSCTLLSNLPSELALLLGRLWMLVLASVLIALALLPAPFAQAADADAGYLPPRGAPFFLLTDATFASTDEARVRLEISSANLSNVAEADGADVALYRVDRPLEFLRQQRNLHRIDLQAAARSEGLANTLSYLWDQWWLRARQIWQNLFSGKLRLAVTKQAPQLKTPRDLAKPSAYVYPSPYKSLPGMTEVQRMRYPVQFAKPIAPPQDLKLAGSSSEFRPPQDGNVYIPLGKQAPGLYVVEAVVGRHRAVALLFVSDTVAVTKTSAHQFFVWTAQRQGGRPAVAQVMWSDLAGVLGSGRTDSHGVLTIDHAVPETSYAFGTDAQGGVFVTENFYYDSEIYNAKLYAYTDRPLYRPGDEVNVRLYGREFSSAIKSTPLAAGPVQVSVLDATGAMVHRETLAYHPHDGAATRFTLPDNAPAGGYEIRLVRGEDEYSAAFRVAPYVKPHFEVLVEPRQASFKTGEAITGRIRLAYPDGKPVRDASLKLTARAQVLTMVEGDLIYGGLFPLQIDKDQELTTNSEGLAEFKLPAASEPSRLVVTVLATDGAAQRVKATKEILIERAAAAWRLQPDRRYAAASEPVNWTMAVEDSAAAAAGPSQPTRWVAVHQDSQTRLDGGISAGAKGFSLKLSRPGSYTIELRDDQGRLLGASPFWVSGGELKPPQGAVEIVLDKSTYQAGDTARALVTFPVAVDDALITLERDQVEAYGRLASAKGMAQVRRLNDRQWEVTVAVRTEHAPNITLSVAYVTGNEFGFQNAGIVVEQPALQVALRTDKPSYKPGETVVLDIDTRDASGRALPAVLSVGAVDEMVYVLQSELAPGVQDFFYHLRRNNVRTQSSLSFISFDEANDPQDASSLASQHNERGVKLLERPRRDDRDTAFFGAAIHTDAQGHAQVRFKVPDALTRWRITAKAYGVDAADGLVGEKRAYFLSDQPFFAKWTAPTWLRQGDKPEATLAVFNQGKTAVPLRLTFSVAAGAMQTRDIQAQPGANFVALDLPTLSQDASVEINLQQDGRTVDSLLTRLTVLPVAWRGEQEAVQPVAAGSTSVALNLPADARDVRLRVLSSGAAAWSRVADSLIEYPYGCVEQTASRLLPLALAVKSFGSELPAQSPLRQRLYSARLRLAAMAGPNAVFGWWGQGTADSAFLSAYAYHADYVATQVLGMDLPSEHWERLLDIYQKRAEAEPLTQKAWTLWLMRDMGLPVHNMVDGLVNDLRASPTADVLPRPPEGGGTGTGPGANGAQGKGKASTAAASAASSGTGPATVTRNLPATSWISPLDDGRAGRDLALVVAAQLAKAESIEWPAELGAGLQAAYARLESSTSLLSQATLVWAGRQPAGGDALAAALQRAGSSDPTIDRALALSLLAKSSGLSLKPEEPLIRPKAEWTARSSTSGQTEFVPVAAGLPAVVEWASPAAAGLSVSVHWRGSVPADAALGSVRTKLDGQVKRELFRLKRKGDHYEQEPVDPGKGLTSEDLYLDVVSVDAKSPLAYALVELALPPGAFLETSTWGVNLVGGDKPVALERAVAEALGDGSGYAIPIDGLPGGQSQVFRHLVRFAQKGSFQLPPARLWRMYQPQSQTLEAQPAKLPWVVR